MNGFSVEGSIAIDGDVDLLEWLETIEPPLVPYDISFSVDGSDSVDVFSLYEAKGVEHRLRKLAEAEWEAQREAF